MLILPETAKVGFSAQVSVRSSPFSGKLTAGFLAGELNRFGREIERLYIELTGKAELQPLEPNITITMIGNGRGNIDVAGSARERLGWGPELRFEFELDQTHLPAIYKALIAADPIAGDAP
jgi:hypothetical protein